MACPPRPTVRDDRPRRARRRCRGRRRDPDGARPMTTARLATLDLPDFGPPAPAPELPAALYADRIDAPPGADGGPRLRPPRRLRRSRAQREPRLPDRLRPALRGGDPRSSARTASRRSSSATSAGAWPARLPSRCGAIRYQDLCLPSQPRDRSRPLATCWRDEGIAPGRAGSASSAGRPTTGPRRATRPSYLVDELRRLVGPSRRRRERDGPADRRRRTGCG